MLQKTREKILQVSLNSLSAISDYRKSGTTTVDPGSISSCWTKPKS